VEEGPCLLHEHSLAAFEQHEASAAYGASPHSGFWSAKPYFEFRNTFKYDAEQVILDKYAIVEEERTHTISNWIQHFSPEPLRREFEATGFMDLASAMSLEHRLTYLLQSLP